MRWSDLPANPTPRTLRQFAAAWLVFLSAMGANQYWHRGHHTAGWALGSAALAFGLLGLWRPAAVRWLFVGAMVLAFPIGWVVSQVMLAVMFYGILTPLALGFRLRGRDVLARKPVPGSTTLWTTKSTTSDVRRYFRQY